MMDIHQRVESLNKLLDDLYKKETRLSSIFARAGFDAESILMLRDHHLESIFNCIIGVVTRKLAQGADGERLCQIVIRRYGLDGFPPETLQELGAIYKISRERVRQLEAKALRKLKHWRRKAQLEEELVNLANSLIAGNKESLPHTGKVD